MRKFIAVLLLMSLPAQAAVLRLGAMGEVHHSLYSTQSDLHTRFAELMVPIDIPGHGVDSFGSVCVTWGAMTGASVRLWTFFVFGGVGYGGGLFVEGGGSLWFADALVRIPMAADSSVTVLVAIALPVSLEWLRGVFRAREVEDGN